MRLSKVTVMVASLFFTLAITATFYQNEDTTTLSWSALQHKIFAGFITATITFIPFSLLSFFVRRIHHERLLRPDRINAIYEIELAETSKRDSMIVMDTFDSTDILFEHSPFDFYVPVWVEWAIVALCLLQSLACAVVAIFYGIQFTDAMATNWIQSFFIGWAVSMFILQTITSLLGAVVGTFSTVLAGLGVVISNYVVTN